MQRWVRLEGQATGVLALDVDQEFLVFGAETIQELWVDGDLEFMDLLLMALHEGVERALEFDAHGHLALHDSLAVAVGAVRVEGAGETLLRTLTGHLHEAECRNGQDMGAGLVTAQSIAHALVDSLLILAVLHVDEVNDDEATYVAQAELAGNLIGRLHVGLEDGLVHVLAPLVAACVHVNRDHGFGLVDDEVAATW